jgi:hypothetical protein
MVYYGTLSKAIVAQVAEKARETLGLDEFAHLIMESIYEQISSRLVQMTGGLFPTKGLIIGCWSWFPIPPRIAAFGC